jgi:predicted dehydrogenase
MSKQLSRRGFLKKSAAATVTSSLFGIPVLLRGQNLNSKLQFAGIGTNGKGWSDIKEISTHPAIVAVAFADVDLSRTDKVKKLAPEAPLFQDYREMFAQLGDKIDAVTVSTPDHMHAYITLDAMRRGKHVYCQKPLTRTVWEARQVRKQFAKSKVITRLGNQGHSRSSYRTAKKLIQSGVIGKVKEVHSWVPHTGHGYAGHLNRPAESVPPPPSLNWDLWIGVAPMRPYGGDRVYCPFTWRDWQDFGSGALGDFGCHIFDPVFTALDITGGPTTIKNENTGMNDEVWPASQTIHYLFPGTEHTAGDTLEITWYDGGRSPNPKHAKSTGDQQLPRSGSIFVGQKGSLILAHSPESAPVLNPLAQYADFQYTPEESLNHYHGWVDGCLSGKQPSDGFEYGGNLTEAVQLGNVAAHFRDEELQWDAENLKITNKPEANPYLTREYREGWEIKEVT